MGKTISFGEVADVPSSRAKQIAKERKVRSERRRAKQDPETIPAYGRYRGWIS